MPRVLFVDDEETILFALHDYFVPQGYEVDVALDRDTAEALLAEHVYAVVVVDLCLGPGQERAGLELVSRVRDRHPTTAVVLVTAYGGPGIESDARRRGVVFLEKPLPLPVMGMVIERLRSATSAGERLIGVTPQTAVGPRDEGPQGRRTRIALYSHDTMGLGHMRRNLLLAQSLCASHLNAVILLIAGAREAAAFTMPPRVDCLTLPALSKDGDGHYSCRHMPISLQQIVMMRSGAIRAALDAFDPDVLIVDNVPRGAVRELDATLASIAARGRTRMVLGLRDVLDDPASVRAEWRVAANEQTIVDHYDAIWVYGDRRVCDPVVEYGFSPEVARRVRYAGYLDQRERIALANDADGALLGGLNFPPGRLVLGAVGGGQDGARLADAFTQAELPPDTNALLLTGPFMPQDIRRQVLRRAERSPRLRVVDFVHEPAVLVNQADRIVAMGGYSTTCEILSFEKHALIVPRVRPRREQWIRAQRLTELGLVHSIHPDKLTPEGITEWLARDLGDTSHARSHLDFGGLRRVPELLQELLDAPAGGATDAAPHRVHHASA